MSEEFLILSLKWTQGETMIWYAPDSNGYTSNIEVAGRFSKEQVSTHPPDNGCTLAVPLSRVLPKTVSVVPNYPDIIREFRQAQGIK